MTQEEINKRRIIAYTPPYVKEALTQYVRQHRNTSVSKFITDAVREKLAKVGTIEKVKKVRD